MNFMTRSFVGEPRALDAESLSLDWFARGDLPDMFPNMAASVQAFERFCQTGEFQMF